MTGRPERRQSGSLGSGAGGEPSVLAIVAVRNEEAYLQTCLDYLIDQGIRVALIDNGSRDATLGIARGYFGKGLLHLDHLPYRGHFDLFEILVRKARLADELRCDWVIHQDADEILTSDRPGETLREGILRADRDGFEAIDFEEFVFLPENERVSYEGRDYLAAMRYYYLFKPGGLHFMRAYKRLPGITNIEQGGHLVPVAGDRVYRGAFVKRHYICLSLRGLHRKYPGRCWSPEGLARGWHHNRIGLTPASLRLPGASALRQWTDDPFDLDRSDPRTSHFWEW